MDINCRLVGSMAKKTSLVNKADIDMFITFDLEYSENELKKYGLEFGRYCIDTFDGDFEIRYASHPYITGFINGFEIDFVPCYSIKDASELKSAVDRTILHTDYIQAHLTDAQADEVLLLKKFMSCIGTYGANYKISGFSGYLCELLILEYQTFENTLKTAANNWHKEFKIDLEDYGTCDNFHDPLIVIDPVDKNRNVAAALRMQKFSEFIIAARNFMNNPTLNYFEKRSITTTEDNILNKFNMRGSKCYILKVNIPDLPDDVIYPQVNKTMNSIYKVSNMYDFEILGCGYYIDDSIAYIILEYINDETSSVKVHIGPRVEDIENCGNFENKYPDAYVNGSKLVAISQRKYKTVEDMIKNILKKENISILKIGKNIKEELLASNFKFMKIDEFLKDCNVEDIRNIYLYLHPNFNIKR